MLGSKLLVKNRIHKIGRVFPPKIRYLRILCQYVLHIFLFYLELFYFFASFFGDASATKMVKSSAEFSIGYKMHEHPEGNYPTACS